MFRTDATFMLIMKSVLTMLIIEVVMVTLAILILRINMQKLQWPKGPCKLLSGTGCKAISIQTCLSLFVILSRCRQRLAQGRHLQ